MLAYNEAVELFERRRLAWLAEDIDAYLDLWAEDVSFQSPPYPEPLKGKAAYAELVRYAATMVRPIAFDVLYLAVHDDMVLGEWRITIEYRADGQRRTYEGMSRATIRHGLITEWREYWNPADVLPAT